MHKDQQRTSYLWILQNNTFISPQGRVLKYSTMHKHFAFPPQKKRGTNQSLSLLSKAYIKLVCASWPKATVKSPVGACIFTFYFLLPWTPCLALPLPCPTPALPCPCPCPALFQIYLLLPGRGGGSYTGNSSSSSSPVGGFAPLDSVTVGGGVRFDGSLVAEMDETSVRLDGWRFERAELGVASFTSPKIQWGGVRGCFTKSLHI
jgi:hypothetical protein